MNSETFRKNIKQILIPEADLQAKIKEVGAQISKEYDGLIEAVKERLQTLKEKEFMERK